MRDFTVEFGKYAKFHGKFTKGVWEIHGHFTGPTAVISSCHVMQTKRFVEIEQHISEQWIFIIAINVL